MHAQPQAQTPHGAWCELDALIAARLDAQRLALAPRGPALAQQTGAMRSPLRGRGLEFEEVRAYQAGDRSGPPATHLETEAPHELTLH